VGADCALAVFKGCHLRFFAYPDARGRLCLVCVERADGVDMFELLVEFGEPIPESTTSTGSSGNFSPRLTAAPYTEALPGFSRWLAEPPALTLKRG